MGGPAVPHLEGEVRLLLANQLKFVFLTSSAQDGVGMMAADEQEDPDVHQAQVGGHCTHTLSPLTASQDVRLVPEENGVPPTVLQVRVSLALPVRTGLNSPIGADARAYGCHSGAPPPTHARSCRSGSSRSLLCWTGGVQTHSQSHLPLNDLERIVDYVSDLGHDVRLIFFGPLGLRLI